MDYKHKQLEQELAAMVKVFAELGARLSEVAREVTSPGVVPSEKVVEQILTSRMSFENVRTAVHAHAGAMLVSPLPKLSEMMSVASIDALLKSAAAAEESKYVIEAEREKALGILARALSITHRESNEFKPLQDCHAKVGELRNAIANVQWPHRHPDSESIIAAKHPTTALLVFVENLHSLDDEKWMALETTITETYGKPLFVAASRGKLTVAEAPVEAKPEAKPAPAQPAAAAPAPPVAKVTPAPPAAPAAPEAPKPPVVAAVEKPAEKKVTAEKAPEKPAVVPAAPAAAPAPVPPAPAAAPAVAEKKAAPQPVPVPAPAPGAPVAPAAAAEKKEVAPEKPAPKPVLATPIPINAERKESNERPHSVPAAPVAPAAPPAAVASAPPPAPVSVSHPAPAPIAAPAPPRPPAPVPVAAAPAPASPAVVNAAPAPTAPPLPAQPAAVGPNVSHSLAALATATETLPEKKPVAAAGPVDIAERQRKEPRLAVPSAQPIAKVEPKSEITADDQKAAAGDASQRPQRWGFWRGNR